MIKKIQFLLFLLCIFKAGGAFAEDNILEVDLYIKDHKFIPNIIELPPNKKIHLTIYNQDSTIEEFESIDLKREKIVLGNSKIKIILANLRPGEYKFFGEFHEETAQGKIIVKEKE